MVDLFRRDEQYDLFMTSAISKGLVFARQVDNPKFIYLDNEVCDGTKRLLNAGVRPEMLIPVSSGPLRTSDIEDKWEYSSLDELMFPESKFVNNLLSRGAHPVFFWIDGTGGWESRNPQIHCDVEYIPRNIFECFITNFDCSKCIVMLSLSMRKSSFTIDEITHEIREKLHARGLVAWISSTKYRSGHLRVSRRDLHVDIPYARHNHMILIRVDIEKKSEAVIVL
jgi:hypothetical protein